MNLTEREGRKNFLIARLEITQKNWKIAHRKWEQRCKGAKPNSETDNFLIEAAMTRMAFLNGQRQLLKELIALEEKA